MQIPQNTPEKLRELRIELAVGCNCPFCNQCGLIVRRCVGLIDTGATATMFSPHLVDRLKLHAVGVTIVHGINKSETANLYRATVIIGDGVLEKWPVIGATNAMDFDVLIGMNIITRGTLMVEHGTSFNFKIL